MMCSDSRYLPARLLFSCVADRSSGASVEEKPLEKAESVESLEITEPPPTVQYAVAEYDFTSETAQALSFAAGDRLVLYSQASPDWWRGRKDGEEAGGLIAASYIRLVSPDQPEGGSDQDQELQHSPPSIQRKDSEVSDDGIISKLPSFKSNVKMWEKKTLDRERRNSNTSNTSIIFEQRTLDRERNNSNTMVTKAPDLLNDVLKVTEAPEGKKDSLVVDTPV